MSSVERAAGLRTALAIAAAVAAAPVHAVDLSSLAAVPQRGQSAEQTRRDRYECHNWAVAETGVTPARTAPDGERTDARDRRLGKVAAGAAIGALIGGLVRGGRAEPGRRGDGEAADGAIGGAVLGAAAGAIAGKREPDSGESVPATEDDYVRALDACLTARGYVLTGA